MKRRAIRKKSTHFSTKVSLRLKAIDGLKTAEVLDCYHGDGLIWQSVAKRRDGITVTGIEMNESGSPFFCYKGNNLEIIDTIDLSPFNVIDLDAYTNPVNLMNKILPRLDKPTVIIYTFCMNRLSGIPGNLSMFSNIQKKAKTITNKFLDDCWKNYLFSNGVEQFHEVRLNEGFIIKKYGFFVYKP